MNIDVGEVVGGKYELVRLLGRGAMGEVWVAGHRSLGEKVAIKFLLPGGDIEPEEQARQRFLFEAQVAAKLSRKTRHIVSVTDHGEDQEVAYLVMELLEGESLAALISRAGPRPLPEVVEIVAQVSRALATAHAEGVFHRDLKSANIFIGRDEDGRMLVKLLDFGIARSIRGARSTQRGMVLGSPSYMSPEQAFGVGSLDHRCDLWALAVVAYEVHTGETPFDGESPDELLYNARAGRFHPLLSRGRQSPRALEQFFARAFAPKIADRFQTAAAMTEAFARAAGVEPRPVSFNELPPAVVPAAAPAGAPRAGSVEGNASTGSIDAAMTAALPPARPARGRLLLGGGIGLVAVALGVTVALRAVGRADVPRPPPSVPSVALGPVSPPAVSVPPPAPVAASPVALEASALPTPSPPSTARAIHPRGPRITPPGVPPPGAPPPGAPPSPVTSPPAPIVAAQPPSTAPPPTPTSSTPPKPPNKDEIF